MGLYRPSTACLNTHNASDSSFDAQKPEAFMPELPEIETIRRGLKPHLVGRRVSRVQVLRADVIQGTHRSSAMLTGCTIKTIDRLGKQLAVLTEEGPCLSLHMGMTGRLDWVPVVPDKKSALPLHTHIVWTIAQNRGTAELRFIDPRRFGGVWTHRSPDELLEGRWAELGPDAATLRTAGLKRACRERRVPIKALLLDQKAIAGIGNIYADEALFASKISPTRLVFDLQEDDLKVLAFHVRRILRDAIRTGGSTIRDYRGPEGEKGNYSGSHAVYGRAGQACLGCGGVLIGTRLRGRTTVYCPACQV